MAELDDIKEWNRKTVADGIWLNDNTIKPIKGHLKNLYDAIPINVVNGVKGANETNYRTGNVSISTTDIGAANTSHTHGHISNDGKSTEEPTSTTKYLRADGTWTEPPGGEQVNADWDATSGKAEILNKPENLVQDANYVHTDNNFTTDEQNKLAGIAAGAEVNVQSDWTVTDSSLDSYIKNKPEIPIARKSLYSSSEIYGIKFATTEVNTNGQTSYGTFLFSRLQTGNSVGQLSQNADKPITGWVQIFHRKANDQHTIEGRITVNQPDYTGQIKLYYKITENAVDWYIGTNNTRQYTQWTIQNMTTFNAGGASLTLLDLTALDSITGLTIIDASYKTPLIETTSVGCGDSTTPVYVNSNGKIDTITGPIPASLGGTGEDTLQKAGNAIINALPEESNDPVDNDYFISQYANGGTTNTNFYRRKLSKLWNWILSKLSSITARQASNGSSVGNRWTHTFVNPNGEITASDFTLQANISISSSGASVFDYDALDNGTYMMAFSLEISNLISNMPYRIWGGTKGAVIKNDTTNTITVYMANGTTFPLGINATFSTHGTTSTIHNGAALVVKLSDTTIYYCPCY